MTVTHPRPVTCEIDATCSRWSHCNCFCLPYVPAISHGPASGEKQHQRYATGAYAAGSKRMTGLEQETATKLVLTAGLEVGVRLVHPPQQVLCNSAL